MQSEAEKHLKEYHGLPPEASHEEVLTAIIISVRKELQEKEFKEK